MAVRKPQIDQIKIKDKTYDINVPKSWAENNPTHVQYIKNRTHYKQLLAGSELGEVASHSFKNIYTKEGRKIYTDNWRPEQSWIYAGRPCAHTDINEHLADDTCSGGWYNIKLQTEKLEDQTATTIDLFNGRVWLEPYQITGGSANTIQSLIKFEDLLDDPEDQEDWNTCEVFYHTDGYFYITGEPTVLQADGTCCSDICTLIISPVADEECTIEETPCYRRYLYTHQLDASFIPVDGKTVFLDNNGKLRSEGIYWNDFQVTEQFGRYEPKEWVPAAGRSVIDVLNDAFCVDKSPNRLAPSVELFAKTDLSRYEVGTTLSLQWAIRLRKGSYTYGLVNQGGDFVLDSDGSKAWSNYKATQFKVTTSISPSEEAITFKDLPFVLGKDTDLSDNCLKENDSGADYKTLISGTAEITLSAVPITEFKMTLNLDGIVDGSYKAATMLGGASDVCFTDTERNDLKSTTSNILTSDYRWFYGYNTTLDDVEDDPRALSSQLGGFPSSLTTDKLRDAYFIAPKAKAANGIMVTNTATGASACKAWQSKEITLKDAGNNDQEYIIYYFENAAADSGKNTYKIEVIK